MELANIISRVTEEVVAQMNKKTCQITPEQVISSIEHSLLNPDQTRDSVIIGCEDAKKYGFANVVITPYFVPMAAKILSGTGVGVCTAVGFPHAAAGTAAKLAEIKQAILSGATELDVCPNYVAIKSGEYDFVAKEMDMMLKEAGDKVLVKIIYEQGLFTDAEKSIVLKIIKNSGAKFLKIANTLTGKKAMEEDVQFVRSIVGKNMGIKIDGGIRSYERACQILASGADRIGLSASVAVAKEALEKK